MTLNDAVNTIIAAGFDFGNPFAVTLFDPRTGEPTGDIPAIMTPSDIVAYVRLHHGETAARTVAALPQLAIH